MTPSDIAGGLMPMDREALLLAAAGGEIDPDEWAALAWSKLAENRSLTDLGCAVADLLEKESGE